jgi:alkanesulfonate monooxygenase SsuD/methylene tetrahydromethanopterin reductase-like flavin-dependent oxidoreductase (luciferase family)
VRTFAFLLGYQPGRDVGVEEVYADLIDDAVTAESLGFDGVWVAEHHFSNYCVIPNPLTLVSALSQRTRRLRIGSAVVVVPLHNPVRVAEEIAMVDQLSGGRLEAILGRGFQPYEFTGLGIPFDESHVRFAEGIDVITGLLATPDFSYDGERFSVPPLTLTPPPAQQAGLPLWLACGSPRSIDAALDRRMHVALTAGVDGLGKLTGLRRAFEEGCASRGMSTESVRFAVQCYTHITPDRGQARRAIDAALTVHRLGNALRNDEQAIDRGFLRDPGPSPADPDPATVLTSTLIGSSDEVAEKVASLRETGITDLFMNFRFGDLGTAEVRDSMAAMAEILRLTGVAA